MNYKLAFPTYRNRYRFVRDSLAAHIGERRVARGLNLGTGEGDYDPMIAPYCEELISCDINQADIEFARELNKELTNTEYRVENALALSFPDAHFDLLVSVDVLEHVGRPAQMIKEVGRVLRPGGLAFITFPQQHFPVTYDPINRALSYVTNTKIAQGAYAFGHEYLVNREEFKKWADQEGMDVVSDKNLSGYLVALSEMYWTGIIQRVFKANSTNVEETKKANAMRPSLDEPGVTKLTDAFIDLDYKLFKNAGHSVGKGFVIRKR